MTETSEVTFTAKDVMALRQKTDLPMMECKKALEANAGDADKAYAWLVEKLKGKMAKRTERATGEGRIGLLVQGDQGVMIEIRTETDFTARNESFQQMTLDATAEAMKQPAGDITASDAMTKRIDDLRISTGENVNFARGVKFEGGTVGGYLHHDAKRGVLVQCEGSVDDATLKGVCQHIVAMDPKGISEADVPAEQIEAIRAEAITEAKETGKPEEIAQKIAEGKVRKFLEDNTLLNQKYVLDETRTVQDVLGSATIQRFVRYTLGE